MRKRKSYNITIVLQFLAEHASYYVPPIKHVVWTLFGSNVDIIRDAQFLHFSLLFWHLNIPTYTHSFECQKSVAKELVLKNEYDKIKNCDFCDSCDTWPDTGSKGHKLEDPWSWKLPPPVIRLNCISSRRGDNLRSSDRSHKIILLGRFPHTTPRPDVGLWSGTTCQ